MNIITLIQSVNKLAFVVFLATLLLIAYEIYVMIKNKKKNEKPKLPDFQQNKHTTIKVATVKTAHNSTISFPIFKIIVVISIMTIIVGLLVLLYQSSDLSYMFSSITKIQNGTSSIIPTQSQINYTEDDAIVLFSNDWKIIARNDNLPATSDPILIGVKKISNLDIIKSRIKINKENWDISDETSEYNEKYNVYYTSYSIATDESKLEIEAQLYSKTDGWLGK